MNATLSGTPLNRVITPLVLVGVGAYALFCTNQKRRLEAQLAVTTRRLSEKEKEADAKGAQVLFLKRGIEDYHEQLLHLNGTNQDLRSRLDEMEAEVREMEIELIQPLTSVCEEMQKQLLALQRDNADLGSQLKEAKTAAHNKRLEVEGLLVREKESYEHNLAQMEFQVDRTEEIAQLEATLRAVEAECRLKSARIEHLTKAQERLLTTEREQWQREVLELKDKLSECYRRLTSSRADPEASTDFQTPPSDFPDLRSLSSYRSPPAYSGPGRMETP